MMDALITLDTTSDGLDDSLLCFNDDGSCTVYRDYNYDGNYEQAEHFLGMDFWGNPTQVLVMADTDNNGVYDTGLLEAFSEYGDLLAHVVMNDYDQDGNPDMMKIFWDTAGDGRFDVVGTIHSDNTDSPVLHSMDIQVDRTGDQTPDMSTHVDFIDSTGNGEPDLVHLVFSDSKGQEISYEMTYDEFASIGGDPGYTTTCFDANRVGVSRFDPSASDPSRVYGDPSADMEYWEYQGPTGRCALYAQKFVIEEALGREVPIEELVAVAEAHGWFDDAEGGTATLNMDKLLAYYGIEHQMSFDNDISAMEDALKNGLNIIAGVDSGQIWYGYDNNIFSPETNADHAVQVIGIDRTNPESPMVVLNDSGTPHGCGELVPLDVFENAWKAGDSQMIVCYA